MYCAGIVLLQLLSNIPASIDEVIEIQDPTRKAQLVLLGVGLNWVIDPHHSLKNVQPQGENKMSEEKNLELEINDPGQAIDMVQETLETFLETADVNKVYAKAVEHEGSIIIPAAEVVPGWVLVPVMALAVHVNEDGGGSGGGGGGGGKTFARPVAVIIADKNGVRVEPVIDPTKIALTALTAFGFIFGTIARMRRGTKSESTENMGGWMV